jgi:5'-deoxynucleotidase YfbR-like HD superfamily hydrolase
MQRQLELVLRGVQTRRFHTHPMNQPETVGHHSALVAAFLQLAYPDCSKNALVYAVFHDLAEFAVGDIPSPTKRTLPNSKQALDALEETTFAAYLVSPPILSNEEKAQVKVADILAGLATCLTEHLMGNVFTEVAWDNFGTYFHEQRKSGHVSKEAIDLVNAMDCMWSGRKF